MNIAALQQDVAIRRRRLGAWYPSTSATSDLTSCSSSCPSSCLHLAAFTPVSHPPTLHSRPEHKPYPKPSCLALVALCRARTIATEPLSRRHPLQIPQCPSDKFKNFKVFWCHHTPIQELLQLFKRSMEAHKLTKSAIEWNRESGRFYRAFSRRKHSDEIATLPANPCVTATES